MEPVIAEPKAGSHDSDEGGERKTVQLGGPDVAGHTWIEALTILMPEERLLAVAVADLGRDLFFEIRSTCRAGEIRNPAGEDRASQRKSDEVQSHHHQPTPVESLKNASHGSSTKAQNARRRSHPHSSLPRADTTGHCAQLA